MTEKEKAKQAGKQSTPHATGDVTSGGQAAAVRSPDAVAAGPGNQVQDNETRPAGQSARNDLQPGAMPDGTASVGASRSRNEDNEQASESRAASGIE
jgi:hypothetical protein